MNYAPKWEQEGWSPKRLTLEPATERLSNLSGLAPVIDLFTKNPLYLEFEKCLPKYLSNNSYHALHFSLLIIAGFLVGYDCMDDMEHFVNDPVIIQMFGKVPTSHAFGDFLRAFRPENIISLRAFLKNLAYFLSQKINPNSSIKFNMDSTAHPHCGDKIEGLEFNYKGQWCLDSLEVFSDEGFCFDFDLRPGNTFSSVGGALMMDSIARPCDLLKPIFDFIRADSAFCNQEFIEMCLIKKLKGTITAHGNIGWMAMVDKITNYKPWIYSKEEILEAIKKGVSLPQVEVGFYMYRPGWAKNISFPVVVKKTFIPYERLTKKQKEELKLQDKDPHLGLWKHYAVLSLMGLYPKSPQQILEFHQGRSNMENMIREGKINFDLTHFPCKPMTANHAYALLGMIAHNLMRTISLLDNRETPHFAKELRRKFIHIPGRIVTRSHGQLLKIPQPYFKEVQTMLEAWAATLDPPLSVA